MNDWIRVLIVDDIEETRKNIRKILSFDHRMEVVGEAANGLMAIELAQKYQPDIVLMDINMPDMNGIEATEILLSKVPKANVIMISVQGETEYLKQGMLAGAKEFVIKPFSPDDLIQTIITVYERARKQKKEVYAHQLLEEGIVSSPKVITIFSGSGGVGKTSIAVNLALSLAEAKKRVALVDMDLLFGDVANYMDISPKRTIYHVVQDIERMDAEGVVDAMYPYSSNVNVLPAVSRPEQAEYVLPRQVERMIRLLKESHDYILIDTPAQFSDPVLTCFDQTDYLLLVSTLMIGSVKNNRRVLDVLESLQFDKAKVRSVINFASVATGLSVKDVKNVYELEEYIQIPEEKSLVLALNQGKPFYELNKNGKWSRQIQKLAARILEENERKSVKKRWFPKLA